MVEPETLQGRDGYDALRRGAVVRLARDVVRAEGPGTASFLQGQLTQDLHGLEDGSSTWSLLLEPQGRITAVVRVTRIAEDAWLLDTDPGVAPALLERLNRFKLRTKVSFETLDGSVLALRGSGAGSGVGGGAGSGVGGGAGSGVAGSGVASGAPGIVVAPWPGMTGVDVLTLGGGTGAADGFGVPWVDPAAYEVLRVEVGVPVMGAEIAEKTLPAEAGLVGDTVSFTKGCYTGQELVARIDSRGSHVPRHLRGFRFAAPVEAGAELGAGGKKVGWVTSVAESPDLGWIGLGYLARAIEVPATVNAARPGGDGAALAEQSGGPRAGGAGDGAGVGVGGAGDGAGVDADAQALPLRGAEAPE